MKTYISATKLFILFLITGVINTTGMAQNKEEHKGKYALQFQITQNFSLSSFQGSIISGKYNFSENDAVRLGISINSNTQDNNGLNTYNNQSQKYSNINTSVVNNYSIMVQYIKNNYYLSGINFYYGGGPNIGYYYSESNYKDISQNNRAIERQWNYGINAIAGVEWYFINNMSLSAEYGILFNHFEDVKANTQINVGSESKTNGFQVNAYSVRFGLAVYF